MQKLKRIKKWNCETQSCSSGNSRINNNNNNNSMISSKAKRYASVTLPKWSTTATMATTNTTTTTTTTTRRAAAAAVKNSTAEKMNNSIRAARRNQRSGPIRAEKAAATATASMMMTKTTTTTTTTTTPITAAAATATTLATAAATIATTTTTTARDWPNWRLQQLLLTICLTFLCTSQLVVKADEAAANNRMSRYAVTTPMTRIEATTLTTQSVPPATTTNAPNAAQPEESEQQEDWQPIAMASANASTTTTTTEAPTTARTSTRAHDSIFMRFAKRFSTGNELWDGIIRDCYAQPTMSCFQKNVYGYLHDALEARDVNVTQRLKFFKNQVEYEPHAAAATTEAAEADGEEMEQMQQQSAQEQRTGRAARRHSANLAAETPIEEVTNALYGRSIKFAMTHDLEVQLPELMFDGATFRLSPRAIEGNGIIAKLELIPKQEVQARLAGKIIMKKLQKFLRSKLLLSFIALLLIIKIIKIKLFWLLPVIIGVGAAKKLLLKFLLFLFPALSHLFKLCSYYQQSYHTTKYHHHHHLINHHHTVVPPWHSGEHHSVPELIYTNPPKGHISTYLHGAPIHESHGPNGYEHFEGAWENSGPGLGSEYIKDINRVSQVEENSNYFKPHSANDLTELHAWGLGTSTQNPYQQQAQPQPQPQPSQQQLQKPQRLSLTQQQQQQLQQLHQQRPSTTTQLKLQQQQQQQQQQQMLQQNFQNTHASSHIFNPFQNQDKQSIFQGPQHVKLRNPALPQSAPNPVYVASPQTTQSQPGHGINHSLAPPQTNGGGLAAQIAAQYDPTQNNKQQQQLQQQLAPELSAQLKEAIRIQAEQRIIAQQQQILEHQPFVQDGQPLYPKNYDPFYSPILLKIDKIVEQLGVSDDLCKERLVCSMYKDPTRYSPHSNFVSAELSRDTSELEPVTNANEAVLRFYRLIQAARDGQEHKDCLSLYPQCSINTE